jgi:hypothetical protein
LIAHDFLLFLFAYVPLAREHSLPRQQHAMLPHHNGEPVAVREF